MKDKECYLKTFLIDYLRKEPSRAGKTYYYYDDDEGNILYATGQPRFGTQGNQTGEEQETYSLNSLQIKTVV